MERIRESADADEKRWLGRSLSWFRRRWLRTLVAIFFAIGFAWLTFGSSDTPAYDEAIASRGSVERTISASGTLQPVASVKVGSQVSGLVTSVYVDFNDEVVKGQMLAVIDPTAASAAVQQAQASIDAAHAAASQAAAAEVRAATDLELRRGELQRQQSLLTQGFTTRKSLDEAIAAFEKARADVTTARAQQRSSSADMNKGRAILTDASATLAHTQIRSPISGMVIERNVESGQTLASAFQIPVLFEIAANLDRMQIETKVDEADIGQVRRGQLARFTVDAYPNETFTGTVRQVRQQAQNADGIVTYVVVIDVPNTAKKLLPGMTANVRIVTGRRESVIRVPAGAYSFTPRKERNTGLRVTIVSSEEAERQRRTEAAILPGSRDNTVLWRITDSSSSGIDPVQTTVGLRGDDFVEVKGGDVKLGDRFALRLKDTDDR